MDESKIFNPKNENNKNRENNSLPILEHQQEIKELFKNNDTFVLVGETGSGKTTQLPLIIREVSDADAKICITQPRRVAARSVSKYVAHNVGCKLGEEVGYQIRFDDHTSEGTKINFVTDGILLKKIQEDPLLLEYSVVMIDEAHERSLNIDFSLGLLKKIQAERRENDLPPLKVVVTSATIEKEKFANYFDDAPVLDVPGRLHKVEMHYNNNFDDYTKGAAEQVKQIVQNNLDGDILIFMTGQDDIKKTIKEIESLNLPDILILPLHGQLSPEEQDKIFSSAQQRKIIVSTNIAETSVTVPGVKHVIDSGMIKQIEFNVETGIESLEVREHAQSGCTQRAGRVGRISAGHCWCLYSQNSFENRKKFQVPEIKRSNLAHVVLIMKKIGIDDLNDFDFIDRPDPRSFQKSIEELKDLGALDEEGQITKIGELMSELPLEPKISRMLIEANKYDCVDAVTTIASFLGQRNVLVRPRNKQYEADEAHRKFKVAGSDFLTLLKVWQDYQNNYNNPNFCHDNFLNQKVLKEVSTVRHQLLRILRRNKIYSSNSADRELIEKSITAGLISDLMVYNGYYSYQRVKDEETGFYIHPSSVVFGSGSPDFFVPSKIVETKKVYARNIQVVKKEWIKELAPHLVTSDNSRVRYDSDRDQVIERVDVNLKMNGDFLFTEENVPDLKSRVHYFAEYLYNYRDNFDFLKKNDQIFQKLNELWLRSQGRYSEKFNKNKIIDVYAQNLVDVASQCELESLGDEIEENFNLKLEDFISQEDQEKILENYPEEININGHNYKIEYLDIGRVEILINPSDLSTLNDFPRLKLGEKISFKIKISEETLEYNSNDFENWSDFLKKAQADVKEKLWQEYKNSANYNQSSGEYIVNNLADIVNIPKIPQAIVFGQDPFDKSDLIAYPALVNETYYSGDSFQIIYYANQQEANRISANTQERIIDLKNIFRTAELEKKAKLKLQDVQKKFKRLVELNKLLDFDADNNDLDDAQEALKEVQQELNKHTPDYEFCLENLEILNNNLSYTLEWLDESKEMGTEINLFLEENFKTCPVCGKKLDSDFTCNNHQHSQYIDLAININGNPVYNLVTISQVSTDKGQEIAKLVYDPNSDIIELVKVKDLASGYWLDDEEYEDEIIENNDCILSDAELAEKDKLIIELDSLNTKIRDAKYYQQDLEYAERMLAERKWLRNKFKLGEHPKTHEQQMECTVRKSGVLIKYIVNKYDTHQPEADKEYFFSERKRLVDLKTFKLIIVSLENPLNLLPTVFTAREKRLKEIMEKKGSLSFKEIKKLLAEVSELDVKTNSEQDNKQLDRKELVSEIEDLKSLWG